MHLMYLMFLMYLIYLMYFINLTWCSYTNWENERTIVSAQFNLLKLNLPFTTYFSKFPHTGLSSLKIKKLQPSKYFLGTKKSPHSLGAMTPC